MLDMATQMRLTGLATGLDTDQLIQNLGRVHNLRIDAVKRDRQMALWRQEAYRNSINMVSNLLKTNFNIANPSSNFRSANSFAKFTYNLSVGRAFTETSKAAAAGIMSVTANGDLKNFNQTVEAVAQLASKDTWTGSTMNLNGITTDGLNVAGMMGGAYLGLSIDGVTRNVEIKGSDVFDIVAKYQNRFTDATPIEPDVIGDVALADQLILPADAANNNDAMTVADFINTHADAAALKSELITTYGTDILDDNGDIDFSSPLLSGWESVAIDFFATAGDGGGPLNRYIANPDFIADADERKVAVANDLAGLFNDAIAKQFGSEYRGMVTATDSGELKFHKSGSNLVIMDTELGAASLATMGLKAGTSTGNVEKMLFRDLAGGKDFFTGADGNGGIGQVASAAFTINGKAIILSNTDTVAQVIAKVNASDAGVTLKYDSSNDKFVLQSKSEGTANNIDIGMGGSGYNPGAALFLNALGIGKLTDDSEILTFDPVTGRRNIDYDMTDVDREEAKNLIAVINGTEMIRQSNTFQHEGMTYTFYSTFNVTKDDDEMSPTYGEVIRDSSGKIKLANENDVIRIDVAKNTAEIVDNIKSFVEEYNKIIDMLNGLITSKREKVSGAYLRPLSDDERKAMSEDEIKMYEEKAKIGILSNDPLLRKLADQMRSAIYQKVEGVGLSMADIGITTSANWQEGGRLVIQEEKLTAAINDKYDEVVKLFTQAAPKFYDDKGNEVERPDKAYASMGIAQRLNQVFNDAVGTIGTKGYLLQRAGMLNDATSFDNQIQKQILQYDERIAVLQERWYRQEKSYVAMFARMETAMSKMISQQNSLASLMAQNAG